MRALILKLVSFQNWLAIFYVLVSLHNNLCHFEVEMIQSTKAIRTNYKNINSKIAKQTY